MAGEWINIKDSQKLDRYAVIQKLLRERVAGKSAELQQARENSKSSLDLVRSKMTTASRTIYEKQRERRIVKAPTPGNKAAPSDGDYVELARKTGKNVVRLNPGQAIDAATGVAAPQTGGGVWDMIGESAGPRRVLTVENNTVVEISDGVKRELPPGELIRAGDTIVIPPAGTPQRIATPLKRVTRLLDKGESIWGGH
jgi:hypothetical protein